MSSQYQSAGAFPDTIGCTVKASDVAAAASALESAAAVDASRFNFLVDFSAVAGTIGDEEAAAAPASPARLRLFVAEVGVDVGVETVEATATGAAGAGIAIDGMAIACVCECFVSIFESADDCLVGVTGVVGADEAVVRGVDDLAVVEGGGNECCNKSTIIEPNTTQTEIQKTKDKSTSDQEHHTSIGRDEGNRITTTIHEFDFNRFALAFDL